MYVHWMVTNIPGNSIKDGVEVMQYVTPFSLEFTEDGEFVTDEAKSSHPLIVNTSWGPHNGIWKAHTSKVLTRITSPKGAKTHIFSNIWPLARPNIAKVGAGRLKRGWGRFKMGEG